MKRHGYINKSETCKIHAGASCLCKQLLVDVVHNDSLQKLRKRASLEPLLYFEGR